MSRIRFVLSGVAKLAVATLAVAGPFAAYRLYAHPWMERLFGWDAATSSIVRRLGLLGVLVLSYASFVRVAERRTPSELAIRIRGLALGAGAGSLSIGVTIFVLFAAGQYEVVGHRSPWPAFDVFGMLAVAAMLEEIFFRGILYRILEERFGTLAAAVASALVFGLVHLSNHGTSAITLATVTLAGLMWAGVFVLSRNLWVTAAHHCCWNATIFAIGLPLSGETDIRAKAPLETALRGSALWTGGGFGPEDSLLNVGVSLSICIALWTLVRRRGAAVAPGGGTPG